MLKKFNLLLLVVPIYLYGITPINIVEVGEKKSGYYGNVNLAFSSSQGNSEVERYSISSSVKKFNSTNVWILSGRYKIAQSNGKRSANSSFFHLRNVLKLFKKSDFEYFGQLETNEFQKLNFRGLLGAGLRFKPLERYRFFIGVDVMFVRETYLGDINSNNRVRGNIYINVKTDLTENNSISYIAYYQPRVDKLKDFDLIQSFEFENRITKNFTLVLNLSYDYDAYPIEDVKKYDFEQTTSLRYKF